MVQILCFFIFYKNRALSKKSGQNPDFISTSWVAPFKSQIIDSVYCHALYNWFKRLKTFLSDFIITSFLHFSHFYEEYTFLLFLKYGFFLIFFSCSLFSIEYSFFNLKCLVNEYLAIISYLTFSNDCLCKLSVKSLQINISFLEHLWNYFVNYYTWTLPKLRKCIILCVHTV